MHELTYVCKCTCERYDTFCGSCVVRTISVVVGAIVVVIIATVCDVMFMSKQGCQSINELRVTLPVSQSISQSVSWSISRSVSQLVGTSVSQSVGQAGKHESVIYLATKACPVLARKYSCTKVFMHPRKLVLRYERIDAFAD